MLNLDSIIKHIKKKTGYDNEYRIKLHLSDTLSENEIIRDLIVTDVMDNMAKYGEFDDESPQEKRERLERIKMG